MNQAVTTRETILEVCRSLVAESGLNALNMREVAARCGVALGSIYNYFPSKSALVADTVESVWRDIFRMDRAGREELSYPDYVGWIFAGVLDGAGRYPRFFPAHSMSFAEGEKQMARERMAACFGHIRESLIRCIGCDEAIRADAFGGDFTPEALADFTLSSLLSLLVRQERRCDTLQELLRRALY